MASDEKSMVIIGAGFAGLAAGIYGRLNGYNTQIYEMHNLPGGLCTAWKRKGYTFDACIHWLVGSSPDSSQHSIWKETGVAQGREFVYPDEYCRCEGADGRTVIFYSDAIRLEEHLLQLSPRDADTIRDFARGVRMCTLFDFPADDDPPLVRLKKSVKMFFAFMKYGREFKKWTNITGEEFANRFRDPLLKEAFREIWIPEFSIVFMLFTFAWLHTRNAGYPIGGSMPMSKALEERYRELGGVLNYNSKVARIITTNGRAIGIRLVDGTEIPAARVISAADGHATLFNMLDGKYLDAKTREQYEKWPLFHSLLFVSLGVNRKFDDLPVTVSGISFPLTEPVMIADKIRERLPVHIYNQDPTMAPEGKTAVTVMLDSDYEYWKKLYEDPAVYVQKKDDIAKTIVRLLEQRFPGITEQVEVTDVATPITLERYTGNWKGSFEGWIITPENAFTMTKPLPQKVPGLKNFYMCGQWVEPGGGLPTSIMSAKRLLKTICKEDGRKFRSK
ncbi:MAG: NAD(P)/FAD-dependent oxidoreductase [Bacteroidales bacterium]|nr:NAD(P)/FAD-dependent oxidoreductase [Bacteroidales bacterium]MDT8372383.1 NAD(P)/FAD-dependent oxidoreductase [Bacteroidales bacterium]